ncbi:unnamed protein product [Larinioides sclopetarius]|uniref:Uncharacterized protein n=1 Tax=Larinioides sclopetarius TaxID=280406 RepID=A0AAV2AYX2_9ARAC
MVLYCCAFNCKEKYVKGGPYTFHRSKNWNCENFRLPFFDGFARFWRS